MVGQLLCSPHWSQVVAVGRRVAEPPPAAQAQPGFDARKLQQCVVDMDRLEEEAAAQGAFDGAASVFCCLGTTRGVRARARMAARVLVLRLRLRLHAFWALEGSAS